MLNRHYQEKTHILEFFGKRLRSARQAANLSQKSLAKRLHIKQDAISNYERGKVAPDIFRVFSLAQALSVNVGYFFPDEHLQNLSKEDREILALLSSLDAKAYDYILMFVQYSLPAKHQKFYRIPTSNPLRRLELFLEQDLYAIGTVIEPRERKKAQIDVLAALTVLILNTMQTETLDASSETIFRKIGIQGNTMNLLVRGLIEAWS
jgi:transcriptional regulator with XRE-family HTH domain